MKASKFKVVIIGVGNIGFTLVKKLIFEDPKIKIVIINRRLPDHLQSFMNKNDDNNLSFIQADVTKLEDLERIRIHRDLQNINVLISTVGFQTKTNDINSFIYGFNGNFFSNIYPVKTFLNNIPNNANNRIIIISSTSGNKAPNFVNSYAPAKFAIENFSSSLQQELANQNTFVDLIRPTNIINEYSQSFKTNRGISAENVSSRIYRQIKLSLNNTKGHGIKAFVPQYFQLIRILERVFPELLNLVFKLKPNLLRRNLYKKLPINKVLITGGSSGLGKELTFLYSNIAKEITITGRDEIKLKEVKNAVENSSRSKVMSVKLNFESINEVKEFSKHLDDFDLIINNAGQHLSKSVKNTTFEDYGRIINTNFLSSVILTQGLLSGKKLKKVVNILSTTAICGRKYHSAYSASKSALWAYSRSLRRQYGKEIHILEIIPSTFQSDLFRNTTKNKDDIPNLKYLMNSGEVAKRIYKAERSGKDILYIPFKARLFLLLESLNYSLFKRLFLR